jgi:hypothetical protein
MIDLRKYRWEYTQLQVREMNNGGLDLINGGLDLINGGLDLIN